jgi:hypothetical protein
LQERVPRALGVGEDFRPVGVEPRAVAFDRQADQASASFQELPGVGSPEAVESGLK